MRKHFALASVLAMASPSPAEGGGIEKASADCGGGLIFVGRVESTARDERIAQLIGLRIAEGLRFGFGDRSGLVVSSAAELDSLEKGARPDLEKLVSSPLKVEGEDMYVLLAGTRRHLSGYVHATLVQTKSATSVELRLTCVTAGESSPFVAGRSQGRKVPASTGGAASGTIGPQAAPDPPRGGPRRAYVAARKVVRVQGQEVDEQLLQSVFSAAKRLADRGAENRPPTVRLEGGPDRVVQVGSEVVIDVGGTSDPDFDAVDLAWSTADADCSGWRVEGSRLFFRSSRAGQCAFTATATELIGGGSASATVVVRTLGKPRVRVGENALIEMNGTAQIALEGRCVHCSDWRWEQLAGPVATLPRQCNGPGGGGRGAPPNEGAQEASSAADLATCKVDALVAGEYTFALTGWNELGDDRREYTVSVAPPPTVIVDVPDRAIIGHAYVLDGSSSHDVVGGQLRYLWEVSRTSFPERCAARPLGSDRSGDWLHGPTQPSAGFRASSTADEVHARLTVFSNRKVGDRTSTNVACQERTIRIEEATWLASLAGGSDLDARAGNSLGARVSAALTIRLPWASLHRVAVRLEQNLAHTSGPGKDVAAFGGSFVGLSCVDASFLCGRMFQPYVTAFARSFTGESRFGAQAGADVRIRRYVFLSAGIRLDRPFQHASWRAVGTGMFGAAYDL